jgi:hypothetical protein
MKQPFEKDEHDLSGMAAMDLFRKEDLNSLAFKLIEGYNPDRFDATILRFFVQKGEPVITIYAVDKMRQDQKNFPTDKLPVKKFKMQMPMEELLRHIKRFDLTISNNAYDVQDILVMNK